MRAIATAVDRMFICALTRFLVGRSHHHTDKSQLMALLAFLDQNPTSQDIFPEPEIPSSEEVKTWISGKLAGHCVLDFCFRSGETTEHEPNNYVYARRFPADIPKSTPTVVIVPGWLVMNLTPILWLFGRGLWRQGISTVVVEPPYHMRRRPKGVWSGEYTISGDLVRTFNSIRQAVVDIRTLLGILRREGSSAIALQGTSMGGWMTSLVAGMESDLNLLFVGTAPVDLITVLNESPFVRSIRKDVFDSGVEIEQIRPVAKALSPFSYPPAIRKDRIRLIGAIHDRVIPPSGVDALWEHWERPILRRYPEGHMSIYLSRRFLSDFFHDCQALL